MEDCKIKKALFFSSQLMVESDGVTKKVQAQVQALEKLGIQTSLLAPVEMIGRKSRFDLDGKPFAHVLYTRVWVTNNELYHRIGDLIEKNHIDVLYVRHAANSSFALVRLFDRCQKLGCKVVLEIPTYPYDSEFRSMREKISLFKDKIFRTQLKRSVNRIVTFALDKEIYGIPTIYISNAISSIPPIRKSEGQAKNSLELITVANIAFWHGLDRIIAGLHNYYQSNPQREVNLTIVGKGDNVLVESLKEQTRQYHLENHIYFVGGKNGIDLDEEFEGKHLAIGCLGCHRKNIQQVKSLKNVEYAMRGLPMVYSEDNSDFDNKDYVFKVPADESDINIYDLCAFMSAHSFQTGAIRQSVSHLTWEEQMKTVLNQL